MRFDYKLFPEDANQVQRIIVQPFFCFQLFSVFHLARQTSFWCFEELTHSFWTRRRIGTLLFFSICATA